MEINIGGFPVLFTREGILIQPRHSEHVANPGLQDIFRSALAVHSEYVAYMKAGDKSKLYVPGIAPEGYERFHREITGIFQQKSQASLARQERLQQEQKDWRAESLRQRIKDRKMEKEKELEQDRSGFVYLLMTETGRYKIGRTNNPERRKTEFEKILSVKVELVCVIACENMWHLEEDLHYKFSTKRQEGEWFDLSPEDIECIKVMAVQA